MQKRISVFATSSINKIKRSFSGSVFGMIGLTIALTLGIANTNKSRADESTRESRDKIAEMTALVRHSEHCPEVPRQWAAAYVILLMMAPPTEEQVVEKEREMLALREKIGKKKWCQLYSVEMEQAYIIYRQAAHR